jgi:hypothetical protein
MAAQISEEYKGNKIYPLQGKFCPYLKRKNNRYIPNRISGKRKSSRTLGNYKLVMANDAKIPKNGVNDIQKTYRMQ